MSEEDSMAESAGDSDTDHVDFESTLEEVESVVRDLESGQLGLSESLKRYEQGIRRIKRCHEMLGRAEHRISVLMSVDEEGNPSVEPVESENSDASVVDNPPQRKRAAKRRPKKPRDDADTSGGLF
ncbi:MAG: exodeoxyribonuclease VII small subunit [Planctomycetota bacterium]